MSASTSTSSRHRGSTAFAGHGRGVILGTGHVDWPGVFGALEERGYRGWVCLDAIDRVGGRAELAAAVEFLRAL